MFPILYDLVDPAPLLTMDVGLDRTRLHAEKREKPGHPRVERSRRAYEQSLKEVVAALTDFDGVWEAMRPGDRRQLLELLIERIGWHGERSDVSIDFRPSGIRCLGEEEPA